MNELSVEINEAVASGNSEDIAAFLSRKRNYPEFPEIARQVVEETYGRALADAFAIMKDLRQC